MYIAGFSYCARARVCVQYGSDTFIDGVKEGEKFVQKRMVADED